MRKKIVAGNWKMNTNLETGLELAKQINEKLKTIDNKEIGVVISPPFSHIYPIAQVVDTNRICVAAQNCASEPKGAFTGEVSAEMLNSIGCKAVIIGHSERRTYFKESNEVLLKKVNLVIENNMKPIFCCGEILSEREAGNHFEIVKKQLTEVVFQLSKENFEKIIIAYEPVWAIGTGVTATAEQAQEMHNHIRQLIIEKFGNEIAENTTILYGGSCNAKNANELFSNLDVDGGLIGGASLKPEDFIQIIKSF